MEEQHAFVGLGKMGKAMARNIASKCALKKPMLIWNRTIANAKELQEEAPRSIVAESLQQIAEQANIIWLCLLNDEAAGDVYNQILRHSVRGTLFVDSSTLSSHVVERLTKDVRAKEADLIAMPVMGEPRMAAAGALICIPAGKAASIERIRPFLDGVLCRATIDLKGLPPKQAAKMKLIGNVLILTTMEQIAEACVLGEKIGLGKTHVRRLIDTMFPSPPHTIYVERMVTGGYFRDEPVATVALALEVAKHILKLADDSTASIGAYQVAVAHLHTALNQLGPYVDVSAMYGAVRQESGLAFCDEDIS